MVIVFSAYDEKDVAHGFLINSREGEGYNKAFRVRYRTEEHEGADAVVTGKHLGDANSLRVAKDGHRPTGKTVGDTDREIDKEGGEGGLVPVRVAEGALLSGFASYVPPPSVASCGI